MAIFTDEQINQMNAKQKQAEQILAKMQKLTDFGQAYLDVTNDSAATMVIGVGKNGTNTALLNDADQYDNVFAGSIYTEMGQGVYALLEKYQAALKAQLDSIKTGETVEPDTSKIPDLVGTYVKIGKEDNAIVMKDGVVTAPYYKNPDDTFAVSSDGYVRVNGGVILKEKGKGINGKILAQIDGKGYGTFAGVSLSAAADYTTEDANLLQAATIGQVKTVDDAKVAKEDLDAAFDAHKTGGLFFANINVLTSSWLDKTMLTPDIAPKAGDSVIDANGDVYSIAEVNDTQVKVGAVVFQFASLAKVDELVDDINASIAELNGYFEDGKAKEAKVADALNGFDPAAVYTKQEADAKFAALEDGKVEKAKTADALANPEQYVKSEGYVAYTQDEKDKLDAFDAADEYYKKADADAKFAAVDEDGKVATAKVADALANPNMYVAADGYVAYSQDEKDKLGAFQNADQYYVKADVDKKVTDAVNGLDWKSSVADLDALKAVKAPKEGTTISVADTNGIYRFDAQGKASDTNPAPADGTQGAWVLLATSFYSVATDQADGLMPKESVAALNTARTDIGTLQGYFENGIAKEATRFAGHSAAYYVNTDMIKEYPKAADVDKTYAKKTDLDGKASVDQDGKVEKAKTADALAGFNPDDKANAADVAALQGFFTDGKAKTALALDGFNKDEYAKKTDVPAVYVLPQATADTLGGIKLGAGFTTDDQGILSVDVSALATKDEVAAKANTADVDKTYAKKADIPAAYVLPAATDKTLGGVKAGAGVAVAQDGTLSVTVQNGVRGSVILTSGTNVGTDTQVPFTDLVIPDGITPAVNDLIIDVNGEMYRVTAAAEDNVTVGGVIATLATKTALDAKADKTAFDDLALTYDAAQKVLTLKLNGKTVTATLG